MSDLVERLREAHEDPEIIYAQESHYNVCAEAADALEAKDAEIARLRGAADLVYSCASVANRQGVMSPAVQIDLTAALANLRVYLGKDETND